MLMKGKRNYSIYTCAMHPDGTTLACGGAGRVVTAIDASSLCVVWEVKMPGPVGTVLYSADGTVLYCHAGSSVCILSSDDGSMLSSWCFPGLQAKAYNSFFTVDKQGRHFAIKVSSQVLTYDLPRMRAFGPPASSVLECIDFVGNISHEESERAAVAGTLKSALSDYPRLAFSQNIMVSADKLPRSPSTLDTFESHEPTTLLHHAIMNAGLRQFGIVAHILTTFPVVVLLDSEDGTSAFDFASYAKDEDVMRNLFKAALDDRCPPHLRGCVADACHRILLHNPECVSVLGFLFNSIEAPATAFGDAGALNRSFISKPQYCGHARAAYKTAEEVWRKPGNNGTLWRDEDSSLPIEHVLAAFSTTQARESWQSDGGILVKTKCFSVPGLVDCDLLEKVLENLQHMSSDCQQQIFTSPFMVATLDLLWWSHARNCWLQELCEYMAFLFVAVLYSSSFAAMCRFPDGAEWVTLTGVVFICMSAMLAAFSVRLGHAEYSQNRMALLKMAGVAADSETSLLQRFVSIREGVVADIGMGNCVDLVIALLTALVALLGLVVGPGDFVASLLSVLMLLGTLNL
jgi:hypothetical protein